MLAALKDRAVEQGVQFIEEYADEVNELEVYIENIDETFSGDVIIGAEGQKSITK
jgi:hypothetical protein